MKLSEQRKKNEACHPNQQANSRPVGTPIIDERGTATMSVPMALPRLSGGMASPTIAVRMELPTPPKAPAAIRAKRRKYRMEPKHMLVPPR